MEKSGTNRNIELIEQCRKGDQKAQMKIYDLYYKQMYNTSLRIVNDPMEAEDIMQESFLTAFRKIKTYTAEGAFGGWLKKIVINNSLDALKSKKIFSSIEDDRYNLPEEDFTRETEENKYLIDEINKAVNQLKEDDRIVLSLFLLEGYDHEEISSILDISYNAARTRYSRAKARLLKILTENRVKGTFVNPN